MAGSLRERLVGRATLADRCTRCDRPCATLDYTEESTRGESEGLIRNLRRAGFRLAELPEEEE